MLKCLICKEVYDQTAGTCPICGCPANLYSITGLGFPKEIEEGYELVGIREGSGQRTYLELCERETGERTLAGKLSLGERQMETLITTQASSPVPELPKVYGVSRSDGGLVFLFEEVEGESLRSKMEKVYPLDTELTKAAAEFMEKTIRTLAAKKLIPGCPDENTCLVTADGFRLADFGGNWLTAEGSELENIWRAAAQDPVASVRIRIPAPEQNSAPALPQGSVSDRAAASPQAAPQDKKAGGGFRRIQLVIVIVLAVIVLVEIILLLVHSMM